MAEQLTEARLVGRDHELAQVYGALEVASNGESRTVIIGGEAGIGKSHLVREALSDERVRSFIILTGACRDVGGSALSFGPVLEALRPLTRQLEEETRRTLLDPVRDGLAGLPSVGDRSASSKALLAERSQAQLFELALALFEKVSEQGPVALVIEDLQWSDRSTRELLSFLVPGLTGSPVALVVTYRSDELAPGHELLRYLAHLQRSRGVLRLHLGRLGQQELRAHLEAIGDRPLDYEVFENIWTRSQGNPFYAEELLALSEAGDVWGMPSTLCDLLLGRIRMLKPITQKVLRLAATGGMTIDHRLLAAVVGDLPEEEVEGALRQAVDAGILIQQLGASGLSFRHALLREVAYGDMLPNERRCAHSRYGRHLPSTSTDRSTTGLDAELAHHYHQAGETGPALAASLAAATAASAAHGYAESRVHLERAIRLWFRLGHDERPANVDLVELLKRTAAVAHLDGDNQRASELARAALAQLEAGGARAEALSVQLAAYLTASGQSEDALAVLEELVASTEGAPASELRAEILGAYARSLLSSGRHRESVNVARQALAIARAVGDRAREAQALTTIGSNLVVLGEPDAGGADLYRALALAEETAAPSEIASGYRDLATTLSGPLNRLDEALEVALRGIDKVSELGLERHWGVSLCSIAVDTLFRLGRWDEAEPLLAEALRRSPKGSPAIDLLLARAKLAVGRGRFQAAGEDLAIVQRLSARAIDLRYWVPLHTLEAGLALWKGAIEEARTAVRTGLSHVSETDDVWFLAPLLWHGVRAEAERAERARARFDSLERDRAVAAAEKIQERCASLCQRAEGALHAMIQAYDLMCQGELSRARGDGLVDAWAESAGSWDALGLRYPSAYARYRWGESLLCQPRGMGMAAPLLAQAHRIAHDLGAAPLLSVVDRLARSAGIDLKADVGDQGDGDPGSEQGMSPIEELMAVAGLTKREAQVLERVSAGDSNRRIAQALFISEKTASVHVSHIMRKLNVSSRVQAAALLHRRHEDLVPVSARKAGAGQE